MLPRGKNYLCRCQLKAPTAFKKKLYKYLAESRIWINNLCQAVRSECFICQIYSSMEIYSRTDQKGQCYIKSEGCYQISTYVVGSQIFCIQHNERFWHYGRISSCFSHLGNNLSVVKYSCASGCQQLSLTSECQRGYV